MKGFDPVLSADTDPVSVFWDVTVQRSASCWRTVEEPGRSDRGSVTVREPSRDRRCSWGRRSRRSRRRSLS